MVEPVFEKINYNQRVGEVKEQIKVEVKTNVRSEDVSGVLSVSPWVSVNESEVENAKLNYGGKIIFYISYLSADGGIKKCECGSEFAGSIKNDKIKDTCRTVSTAVVDKAEADNSGSYLTVIAYLTVSAQLIDCNEVSALTGGEQLVVKENQLNCVKSLGVKRGTYPIEEEFELSYPIEEVLFHRANGVITAVQSGVGTIIVDGEVLLSLVLLQKNDKNDIIRENRVLPFRMEIECEEAMPNMQATAKVRERAFKTDISVDEESGKSVVNASVTLSFEGEAFTSACVTVASDVFSTENEVELQYENFPSYKACDLRGYTEIINGKSTVNELPVGATVLAVGGEKATVISTECNNSGIAVTGILSATAFMKDGDSKVFVRRLEVPFERTLDSAFNPDTLIEVVLKAERASAKIVSLTEVEIEAEVFFTVYPVEKYENKVVKEIKVLGEKKKNTSAISVYIPEEGEELWSLSKRLNVCPEQLVSTNKELQFPLTGQERIVVYRRR